MTRYRLFNALSLLPWGVPVWHSFAQTNVPSANNVFILTDDLSKNLVQYMPHVLEMQRKMSCSATIS